VGRLATLDESGFPRLVPVVFAVESGEIVTAIDGKPKRSLDLARVRNLENDPRVSLLVDHYQEDWRRLWWVRIDGRGSVESFGPTFERALAALRDKYLQYESVELPGPVIRIHVDNVRSWRPPS
jgi:PPOX class probable F420-dependent enzyme